MRAYVSGQAAAAVETGSKPRVYRVGSPPTVAWNAQDALRVFDGCSDVRLVTSNEATELGAAAEAVWAADRAIRLFLLLLDPLEPVDELVEYAECVEELFEKKGIRIVLQRILYSAPLPSFIEVVRVEEACSSTPQVRLFFREILDAQLAIGRVRAAFDAIPFESFNNEHEKRFLLRNLIDDGSVLQTVRLIEDGKDLNYQRMEIISRHRSASTAIAGWFSGLQKDVTRLPKALRRSQMLEEVDDSDDLFENKPASRAEFEKVIAQQKAIIGKLKDRDLHGARWLMSELIASQQSNSTTEQIAKSYSSMAQAAKFQEVPDLQVEWATEATIVNPDDHVTFGHLADALIHIGSYNEARSALDKVEEKGDPLFAANGRARILRQTGQVREAREAYLLAAETFCNFPKVVYSLLGAAEALRELGDVSASLEEYRNLTEQWPLEASVWMGFATTLMETGVFAEAIRTFGKADSHDRRTAMAKAGKANAYRVSGDLDRAMRLYEEVLADFPNNLFALCGRAKVFQLKGMHEQALKAFAEAIQRSPYSPEPINGKGSVLRDMGLYSEALETYRSGIMRFPYDRRLASGIISVLRAQGMFAEALSALDDTISRFPFDMELVVLRASVLSRLGVNDAALDVYDSVLELKPLRNAMLGKASLLIKLDRTEEASALLPEIQPTTRADWRQVMLRSMLLERIENIGSAINLLRVEIGKCPFLIERRKMRDILISLEMKRGRINSARKLVDDAPEEVSNVVAFHVFALARRSPDALSRLAKIRSSQGPADIIELAKEIARRHSLSDEPPQHSEEWIFMKERHILLAEAA